MQRPQSSPKVPESLRGAQLPEEVTSRQSAMSSMNTDSSHYSGGSSIQTRAICEQRFEVHSCVYYRRFELGSPSCNHPRACDPNVFDDPSQTIVSKLTASFESCFFSRIGFDSYFLFISYLSIVTQFSPTDYWASIKARAIFL